MKDVLSTLRERFPVELTDAAPGRTVPDYTWSSLLVKRNAAATLLAKRRAAGAAIFAQAAAAEHARQVAATLKQEAEATANTFERFVAESASMQQEPWPSKVRRAALASDHPALVAALRGWGAEVSGLPPPRDPPPPRAAPPEYTPQLAALLNEPDGEGRTLLHQVAGHGSPEVAAELVAAGADPCLRTVEGLLPLDVATLWHSVPRPTPPGVPPPSTTPASSTVPALTNLTRSAASVAAWGGSPPHSPCLRRLPSGSSAASSSSLQGRQRGGGDTFTFSGEGGGGLLTPPSSPRRSPRPTDAASPLRSARSIRTLVPGPSPSWVVDSTLRTSSVLEEGGDEEEEGGARFPHNPPIPRHTLHDPDTGAAAPPTVGWDRRFVRHPTTAVYTDRATGKSYSLQAMQAAEYSMALMVGRYFDRELLGPAAASLTGVRKLGRLPAGTGPDHGKDDTGGLQGAQASPGPKGGEADDDAPPPDADVEAAAEAARNAQELQRKAEHQALLSTIAGLKAKHSRQLWRAAAQGNLRRLRACLCSGRGSPTWHNPAAFGYTALHSAAANGDDDAVLMLLQAGVRPTIATPAVGVTPLHVAAWRGHIRTSKLLSAAGGSVSAPDSFGDTPLHDAAEAGHAMLLRLLCLSPGAVLDAANGRGWTPLHKAAGAGHLTSVKELLHALLRACLGQAHAALVGQVEAQEAAAARAVDAALDNQHRARVAEARAAAARERRLTSALDPETGEVVVRKGPRPRTPDVPPVATPAQRQHMIQRRLGQRPVSAEEEAFTTLALAAQALHNHMFPGAALELPAPPGLDAQRPPLAGPPHTPPRHSEVVAGVARQLLEPLQGGGVTGFAASSHLGALLDDTVRRLGAADPASKPSADPPQLLAGGCGTLLGAVQVLTSRTAPAVGSERGANQDALALARASSHARPAQLLDTAANCLLAAQAHVAAVASGRASVYTPLPLVLPDVYGGGGEGVVHPGGRDVSTTSTLGGSAPRPPSANAATHASSTPGEARREDSDLPSGSQGPTRYTWEDACALVQAHSRAPRSVAGGVLTAGLAKALAHAQRKRKAKGSISALQRSKQQALLAGQALREGHPLPGSPRAVSPTLRNAAAAHTARDTATFLTRLPPAA